MRKMSEGIEILIEILDGFKEKIAELWDRIYKIEKHLGLKSVDDE